ncbi:MAG: DNA polymerase III subunit gamma/tau [Actinomycetota bacterium]|nr:DNA polymerase III subunit gamma/tau [Actinomycetota bacterium]
MSPGGGRLAGNRKAWVIVAEEKQYQSLYRKYRPQVPEEVLGQEHVVRALVGSVKEGRLAHAFLFCGPRGTGKTSTARILAKMVNCEQGPTPEPCGVCEQCLRIRDGSHLDVVEIDAASHGGVDDARELRERAPTAPAQGREKVYIIDEAQRLSREAFDALLKVFEEPPPGVRFVLCTTEPHKMPATIVGRCQRFDFRRGSGDVVAGYLMELAKREDVVLDEAAAHVIARQSEGSFRDALSLLDQASVLGGGKIDAEVIQSLLGAPRAEVQYAIADAVAVGDTAAVFELVNGLVQEGQDLRHVTVQCLQHFRNLLLANTAPGQADLVDVPEDEYERLRTQASKLQPAEISRVIALLLAAQTDMRWTTSPRLTLELALVRASMPEADPSAYGLVGRIERLERLAGVEASAGGLGPAAAPPRASPHPTPAAEPPPSSASLRRAPDPPSDLASPAAPAAEDQPASSAVTGPDVDVQMLRRSWQAVLERGGPVLRGLLETATPVAYDGTTLELAFPPNRKFAATRVAEREQERLRRTLQEVLGISPKVKCLVREPAAGPPVADEDPPLSEEAALARLQSELDATISAEPE